MRFRKLICRVVGHNPTTLRLGTSIRGGEIVSCLRCDEELHVRKWGLDDLKEWPTLILTTEECIELARSQFGEEKWDS